ncbi:uncharacterized protein LOC134206146 [Armigeres subalbatus]|uniref:uncharacterized protein LOC134206146 n=1 Tax=Armigeres subalbatus TaxID=124917 RepID=UPI002ED0714F
MFQELLWKIFIYSGIKYGAFRKINQVHGGRSSPKSYASATKKQHWQIFSSYEVQPSSVWIIRECSYRTDTKPLRLCHCEMGVGGVRDRIQYIFGKNILYTVWQVLVYN